MINKWHGIGRCGKDPEIRYSGEGVAITSFSLACSEKYKTKSGEQKEITFWGKCVAFGKLAEIIAEFCHKGSLLYVSGKLQERSWNDKEGIKRYVTEIVLREMQFLDKKGSQAPADVHDAPADDGDVPF